MGRSSKMIGRRGLFATAAAALTGCGNGLSLVKSPGVCEPPPASGLIIDIHCHLMNLRDADNDAFVERHVVDADEKSELLSFVTGVTTTILALPNRLVTMSGKDEFDWLTRVTTDVQSSPQAFCNAASNEQGGIFFAAKGRHALGFASNRARNAALLIDRYPRVDIFTPLMVDFHEGEETYSHPEELVDFYSQLNVATRGRFLPMVSFNPSRAWAERDRPVGRRHLDLIKDSIENKGFVGVKMHPSTGFSPIENHRYGCPNSPMQKQVVIPEEQARFYDKILHELLVYCRGADVPVLIHSGEGIPANATCMKHTFVDHSERPNAPLLWERAIQAANGHVGWDFAGCPVLPERRLRFCFAHLAGGFAPVKGRVQPHPWLRMMEGIMQRNTGIYIDLSDFADAFEKKPDEDNGDRRIREVYQQAFAAFLDANGTVAQNMMYGSDWHMPSVAQTGKDYLEGVESMIPSRLRVQTMGGNAVAFLGLAKDQPTRRRLERFYERNKLSGRIPWMEKIGTTT